MPTAIQRSPGSAELGLEPDASVDLPALDVPLRTITCIRAW